ncbi:DNA topoisomerase III [Paenibacillus sp. HJGM_3]|uniref:DNA topoisomerase III n=1 Tax=Paenibacillus sp. HJGM_3 TaxID=3379816 RepID=UPI0038592446
MKSLVLAEKPSVAKEIARVLGCGDRQKSYYEGSRYVVTWALGHLVTLAEPEDYDAKYKTWNMEDLPILPAKMTLKVMRETSHQFKAIAQLCKRGDIGDLIVATDAGREGELVARWIMDQVHWRKPFQRLWISSQTDKAIREGFQRLKPGNEYNGLYASAVCRAEADWLIGLNVTRALTSKYGAQLAAGRVQTPTLAMLMEREREIAEFRSVPFWTVTADFGSFRAKWRRSEQHDGRLFDEPEAEALAVKLGRAKATVESVRMTEKQEPQPLAYDLTELQRDANKKLGFSAKQTSSVLQRLYEQHKLVTYPRTDSRYLTSDMAPTFKSRLDAIAIGPYAALIAPLLRRPLAVTKRFVDDSKVTDHHAIIPTEQYVNLSALSPEERRLYDLIVRRFIALFYPPYRYAETSVVIEAAGERLYAKGVVPKDSGWREAYGGVGGAAESDADEDDDPVAAGGGGASPVSGSDAGENRAAVSQRLPELTKGQPLAMRAAGVANHRTQPPGRYTEAALLTRMEQHHLGTPATRADIIEKLLQTDTVERKLNRLTPTGKGKQLIELVADDLRSPDLTARWEQELERIARGQGNAAAFMDDIRKQTVRLVREVKASEQEYKPHNLTHSKCPECGTALMERKGKRGKLLVCSNRECRYHRAAEPALTFKRCPQCHKRMEVHMGKAGKYAQCRPCNVIEMLEEQNGSPRVQRKQQAKLAQQYSDNESFGSSLADALKAAMEKNGGK